MSLSNTIISENNALVKVVGHLNSIQISVTDDEKPAISQQIFKKWQSITNLMADIIGVPAGLIMKLHKDEIEVFVSSESQGNPYKVKEKEHLNLGLYCETVVGRKQSLLVPDARKDPQWEKNPDMALNMYSYLGMPISWPDGQVFGTICVLDNKENHYNKKYKSLVTHFREVIENDLEILLLNRDLQNEIERQKLRERELNHRMKNNYNMLINLLQIELDKDGADLKQALIRINSALHNLSSIHEKLFREQHVSLREFVEDMSLTFEDIFHDKELYFELSIEDVEILPEKMITLGLLINELVTNSLKYAFNGRANPIIAIDIRNNEDNSFCMTYSNNGSEINKEAFNMDDASLGRKLIKLLPRQLGGELMDIDYETASFLFCFNLK